MGQNEGDLHLVLYDESEGRIKCSKTAEDRCWLLRSHHIGRLQRERGDGVVSDRKGEVVMY